jgi:uncharacterized protein (TIGR00730 family)
MPRRICVYCGSQTGLHPDYHRAAAELGAALGRRGLGLVYGGGNIGLMGLLADAALLHGAEVIGVIPQPLEERELAHEGLHELIVVDSMHQRKAVMAARAHAFIALPGGYGTLEELFEMVTWAQLGFHRKPVALLNIRGYFDHLLAFLDHAVGEAFLRPRHRPLVRAGQDIDALLETVLGAAPSA